ncbi:MAG: hypothetical protein V1777_00525 [Candidatus Micrarchaeota archaeon]
MVWFLSFFMGVIGQVLAFFRRMFSSENSSKTAGAVELNRLSEWLNKQEEPVWSRFESKAQNSFSKIRFVLGEIASQTADLSKQSVENEKGNARLRKVVSSSRQTVVPKFRQLVSKLEPPKVLIRSAILDYSKRAYPLLQTEIRSTRKNLAYTGILLKDEMQELGKHFGELEQLTRELYGQTQEPVFVLAENCQKKADELGKLLKQIQSDEQKANAASQTREQLQNKIRQTRSELALLSDSDESREAEEWQSELEKIRENQNRLQDQFTNLVGKADKPLRRFSGAVQNNQWVLNPQNKAFLERFSTAPWPAIQSDPKAILFKEILVEVQSALEQQKVTAKDNDEKQKWLNSIRELLQFDFFSEFFWKQNRFLIEKQKLEKQLAGHPLSKKISETKKQLESVSSEFAFEQTNLQQIQSRLQKNRELAEQGKAELEKTLSKIAGQPIAVAF